MPPFEQIGPKPDAERDALIGEMKSDLANLKDTLQPQATLLNANEATGVNVGAVNPEAQTTNAYVPGVKTNAALIALYETYGKLHTKEGNAKAFKDLEEAFGDPDVVKSAEAMLKKLLDVNDLHTDLAELSGSLGDELLDEEQALEAYAKIGVNPMGDMLQTFKDMFSKGPLASLGKLGISATALIAGFLSSFKFLDKFTTNMALDDIVDELKKRDDLTVEEEKLRTDYLATTEKGKKKLPSAFRKKVDAKWKKQYQSMFLAAKRTKGEAAVDAIVPDLLEVMDSVANPEPDASAAPTTPTTPVTPTTPPNDNGAAGAAAGAGSTS